MSAAGDLAAKIADLQRRIVAMERSSQARNRSVEAGTFRVYDVDGNEVISVGRQEDDSYQIVGVNGGKVVADEVTDAVRDTLTVADESITAAKLAAGAVTETKIADDSISTQKLIAGAVDTLRLAAEAVSADKLAANSVTAGKIAALAVEADKIAANAITSDKIEANSITAGKLAAIISLVTRLVAGDPAAQRVELNSSGLFAYDPDGEPTFSLSNNTPDFISVRNAGNTTASISQDGVISGSQVTAESMTLGGSDLSGTILGAAQGIVAWTQRNSAEQTWPTTTTEVGLIELAFDALPNRCYAIMTGSMLVSKTAADGGRVGMRIRYTTGGATPTISSSTLCMAYHDEYAGGFYVLQPTRLLLTSAADEWRLLLTLVSTGTASSVLYASQSILFYVVDMGARPAETGVLNTGGGSVTPVKKQYTKTYNATWSRSYNGSGDWMSDQSTVNQGYYSATRGNQHGMVGFPSVTTDLSGATVDKIEVYLYFEHWYSNSGGTAILGCHGASSAPATSSGAADLVRSSSWPKPGGRWVTLPSSTYDEWKAGTYKGILVGPGPTTSTSYYGKARGYGQTYQPQLRVTFTK